MKGGEKKEKPHAVKGTASLLRIKHESKVGLVEGKKSPGYATLLRKFIFQEIVQLIPYITYICQVNSKLHKRKRHESIPRYGPASSRLPVLAPRHLVCLENTVRGLSRGLGWDLVEFCTLVSLEDTVRCLRGCLCWDIVDILAFVSLEDAVGSLCRCLGWDIVDILTFVLLKNTIWSLGWCLGGNFVDVLSLVLLEHTVGSLSSSLSGDVICVETFHVCGDGLQSAGLAALHG